MLAEESGNARQHAGARSVAYGWHEASEHVNRGAYKAACKLSDSQHASSSKLTS